MLILFFLNLIFTDNNKNSENIKALFQELKILAHLHDGTSHLNILRLIGCYISEVVEKRKPILSQSFDQKN